MANYSLIANSTFQPFTFQELLAPLAAMSTSHEKYANEYDELNAKASLLEAMGQNEMDKDVYLQYKNYVDKLRTEADNLYRNGLSTETRRRLSDMRSMYNDEIVPIQNALSRREKEYEVQQKAKMEAAAKGLDMRFSRDASTTGLKEYINNPYKNFNTVIGQHISAEVGAQFEAMAKQITKGKDGQYWIDKTPISPIEYSILTNKGMTFGEYMKFRNDPYSEDFKNIRGIIMDTLRAHRIDEFDPETQNDMFNYGAMGVVKGVGGQDLQFREDKYASKLIDQNFELAKAKISANGKGKESETSLGAVNPLPVRSQREISETNKKINDYLKNGYIYKDPFGNYKMTSLGWKEYKKMYPNQEKKNIQHEAGLTSNYDAIQKAKQMPDTVPSDFRNFMDTINNGNSMLDEEGNVLPEWTDERAGELFKQGVLQNDSYSYDTYHSTEYDRTLTSEEGNAFMKQLWAHARSGKDGKLLDEVDFDGQKGWKVIDSKDPKNLKDYKVTNIRYNRYGTTAVLYKEGESPIRVKVPKGMNLSAEGNVLSSIATAEDCNYILRVNRSPMRDASGQKILRDNDGNIVFSNMPLSDKERQDFVDAEKKALKDLYGYGAQYMVQSKTEVVTNPVL